jgi:hypothetical protein
MALPARLRRLVLAATVLALATTACGGGGDDDASDTTVAVEADETAPFSTSETSGGDEIVVELDEEVWFAGFAVGIGEVTAPPVGEPGIVEITTTYENLSTETARFDATVLLSSAGADYQRLGTYPEVAGGRTADGTFEFEVFDTFDIDDAVLTIGRAGNNQAIVPLGDAGELVTLEPVDLEVAGQVTVEGLDAMVTGAEVRADIPDTHTQMEEGRLALLLTFDLTYTASENYTGGYAFSANNLALMLPDGTTVTPIVSPIELLDSGATLRDQLLVFEIDNPPAGAYELVLIQNVGESTEATWPFELGDDIEVGVPDE